MLLQQYSVPSPHAYARLEHDDGTVQEADVLTCAHCGHHWIVRPGSGIRRGFCLRCQDVLCSPTCTAPCTGGER